MGIANSSLQSTEGDHFTALINPRGGKSKQESKKKGVQIHCKAAVLKHVSHQLLWDCFLSGTAASFALTASEASELLKCSKSVNCDIDGRQFEVELKQYVELIVEMSEKDASKAIDIMSICSAVLLINDDPIEVKIDQLFDWIVLSDKDEFDFDDFLVAMSSFERGLSHAMGHVACKEAFIKLVSSQWMALADPLHKGSSDAKTRISKKNFFEFCTNRQHVVRRLLEALGSLIVSVGESNDLQEVVAKASEQDSSLEKGPSGGDEWMSNPAWKKTAEKMVPKGAVGNNTKPSSSLQLQWVHGYRGFDCRNNVRYIDGTGGLVSYTAAALVIAQDNDDTRHGINKKQNYFGEHTDDIISNAVYESDDWSRVLMASGEMGKTPAIHLYTWEKSVGPSENGSFHSVATLKGLHKKGVVQLAFSGNGKKLFTVGVDYSIAVYNTDITNANACGKMIASSQGPKDAVFHVCASGESGEDFISCGDKHACLWRWNEATKSYAQENCKLGSHKSKGFLSAARATGGCVVLGTSEGDLIVVRGTEMPPPATKSLEKVHDEPKGVNALWTNKLGDLLVSGGKNGRIIVWRVQADVATGVVMTRVMELFDRLPPPSGTTLALPAVRSVCLSSDLRKVLIGLQTCEVLEYFNASGAPFVTKDSAGAYATPSTTAAGKLLVNVLVSAHFKDELWGLAIRPNPTGVRAGEFVTVGDDGFLRLWEINGSSGHRQSLCQNMQAIARCCDFSPDGMYLAVGYGGCLGKKAKNKEDGMVRIYRFDEDESKTATAELTVVYEIKEAKQWISVVRFSPDGVTLAVGARDNSIYLYSVTQQFKRKAKFSKHGSGILMLDFSSCSQYLQSCCSAYEILFSEVSTGAQITNGASKFIDTIWATWTCSLGWCVQGIWHGDMNGSDVHSVHRSSNGQLIASADSFGKVNIYRCPALLPSGCEHHAYTGHSSFVTNVRWLGDEYLISCGGNDKCVFVWKNNMSDLPDETSRRSKKEIVITAVAVEANDHGTFEALDEGPSGGDEFTAVKPWLGAIVAPTAWAQPDAAKAAPFHAALGEMSSQHKLLRSSDLHKENEDKKALYEEVARATRSVLTKSADSGIINSTAPSIDELELEWVHGYRGFDCRNNVQYVFDTGSRTRYIVYHAAALGIVADPEKQTQKYFRGHTDDIMSLAVLRSISGTTAFIIATGQQAVGNTFVWEVPSMKTLAVLQTKQKSVNMLEFSLGGRLLVSIAEDKTIAVSDWKCQTILVNTKGEGAVTFQMASLLGTGGPFQFVSVGDKHIKLWNLDGRNLTGTKVSTGSAGPQGYLCVVFVPGKFLIGAEDGNIYIVSDNKTISSSLDHHHNKSADEKKKLGKNGGAVTVLAYFQEQELFVSGAKNGSVVLWKHNSSLSKAQQFSAIASFNVDEVGVSDIFAKQVQSLSIMASPTSPDFVLLLVSTRGCDMFEVQCPASAGAASRLQIRVFDSSLSSSSTSSSTVSVPAGATGVITRGHCNDEVWGVACHPSRPEYCTVGDDKTLRLFNVQSKKMIAVFQLGAMARTCCYHPGGQVIAVGFGGRVGRGKEAGGGLVRLYPASLSAGEKFTMLCEVEDAKQWTSDIKFSSDGRTLVVAAHDCKIYIYDVTVGSGCGSLKLKCTFAKHNSVVNHVDLSADGRFMQSNCSACELLFCDTTTGKQITSATELRDVKWDTWTCTFGWPVQGIWTGGMNGSDINAVSRSNSGHLVATSDDFGKVNIYRYPCVAKEGAQCLSYSGHSSHVMNVRWTMADECLVSCGGNDKCIMQWRHTMADANAAASSAVSQQHAGATHLEDIEVSLDDIGGPGGGDESGCVKPWLGAIRAPKNPPPSDAQAPAVDLALRWVHGYTSASAGAGNTRISSNLFYNVCGDIVYPAAALGIKLHKGGDAEAKYVPGTTPLSQSYMRSHDDDILCLTMSKDRRFVCTGQTASKQAKGKGCVCVWDANSCALLSKMEACHQRGVASVAFSPNGSQLISVGQDDNNVHILWTDAGGNWSRVQKTAEEKSDKNVVSFSKWVHEDNGNCRSGDYIFVSGGNGGMNFWKLEGAKLSMKPARYGRYTQSAILCVANLHMKDGFRVVVGLASGDMFVFEEREVVSAAEKAHTGPVLSLAEGGADCTFLVSGGRDKTIKIWNQALQPISVFDVCSFSLVDGSVGSVDVRPAQPGSRSLIVLAGTYGGEIVEIRSSADMEASGSKRSLTAKSADAAAAATVPVDVRNMDLSGAEVSVLVFSHFSGELWGLATHPIVPDIMATAGDDGTLRIWSLTKNIMLGSVVLGWPARSVAWHPTGFALAVGFHEAVKGGVAKAGADKAKGTKPPKDKKLKEGPNEGHAGAVHIYSYRMNNDGTVELKKRADGCSSLAWIQDVKFTPDGAALAVCSHDKKMYMYSSLPLVPAGDAAMSDVAWDSWTNTLVGAKYAFNKHSSAVLHVDFSVDCKYFQTNCQAGELLFGTVTDGKQETSASKLADYNSQLEEGADGRLWNSQTCHLGWPVQGIFPPGADSNDVRGVDRHVSGKLLATSDDFGHVKLFRYPCVTEGAKFLCCDGHSSHVTCVRWTVGNHLVSVGGNDKCAFVWEMTEK